MKDALGHGSDPRGGDDAAHAAGVSTVGRTAQEWLDRHQTQKMADGRYVLYHGTPKTNRAALETSGIRQGSYLAENPEDARFFAARDRGLKPSSVQVYGVHVGPRDIHPGVFPTAARPLSYGSDFHRAHPTQKAREARP